MLFHTLSKFLTFSWQFLGLKKNVDVPRRYLCVCENTDILESPLADAYRVDI